VKRPRLPELHELSEELEEPPVEVSRAAMVEILRRVML